MIGGNPNHPHAFSYILTSYYLSHLHPKGGSSNTPKKDPPMPWKVGWKGMFTKFT
jgi:hypothetical protein